MKTLVLTCLGFFSSVSVAEFKYSLNYSDISNLIYNLDCISDVLNSCSRTAYKDLWGKEFLKSGKDKDLVEKWGKQRKKYQESIRFSKGPSEERFLTGERNGVDLFEALRKLSFLSKNFEEYSELSMAVLSSKDYVSEQEILSHFYHPYAKWFKKTAKSKGNKFKKQIDKLLKSPKIKKLLNQYLNFYGLENQPFKSNFNLFYRPKGKGSTHGQELSGFSVIEFMDGESPEERLDVIIHELSHGMFEKGSKDILIKEFKSDRSYVSRGAYNLLNEVVASILGNGFINEVFMNPEKFKSYYDRKKSFYSDYYIDKGAKASFKYIKQGLDQGLKINSVDFVKGFTKSLQSDFKNQLKDPSVQLKSMNLILDEKIKNLTVMDTVNGLKSSSVYSHSGSLDKKDLKKGLDEHKDLNVLIIATPNTFSKMTTHLYLPKGLRAKLNSVKPGEFRSYFPENAPGFYFVSAKDRGAVLNILKDMVIPSGIARGKK